MDEHNPDYDAVLAELLSDLHDIAVCQVTGGKVENIRPEMAAMAGQFDKEDVQLYYQIALNGRRDLPGAPEPRTGFEMTMIRMLAFRPAVATTGGRTQPVVPIASNSSSVPSIKISAPAQVKSEAAPEWQKVINDLELSGLVKEFAGHCVLKEQGQNRIHLVLRPAQEHLLKTTQKDKLQKAITDRFGMDIKLIISVEESGTMTPTQQKQQAEQDRQTQEKASFQQDPFVKEMQDTFNATIDLNSIQPK